jgi:hypothetical protein
MDVSLFLSIVHGSFIVKVIVKYTLFNLGMIIYSYERQDIIQFALKRLHSKLSDLALPLHVANELLEKCSHHVNLVRYSIK